jgi:hypothetical protein
MRTLRSLLDASTWLAPAIAAWALGRVHGAAEIVSVLAIVPALSSTLLQRRGAIAALFATALAWIGASIGYLEDWRSLWNDGTPFAAGFGIQAAWWAPWALSSVMLRGSRPANVFATTSMITALIAFAGFFYAPLPVEIGQLAIAIVAVLGFIEWMHAAPIVYAPDPNLRLWLPMLPVAILFTAIEYIAGTSTFAGDVDATVGSSAIAERALTFVVDNFWHPTGWLVVAMIEMSATATAACAVAIGVARARGNPLWALACVPALAHFLAYALRYPYVDIASPTTSLLQALIDAADRIGGAAFTAGTTLPLLFLAIRRARFGIRPSLATLAVGALAVRVEIAAQVAVITTDASIAWSTITLAVAWLLIEPPTSLRALIVRSRAAATSRT